MPKVGDRKFGYGKAGKKAAKRYAKKTGKRVTMAGPKKKAHKTRRMASGY